MTRSTRCTRIASNTVEPMAQSKSGTTDSSAATPSGLRRRVGVGALAVSILTSTAWAGWRVLNLGAHPVELAVVVVELVGFASGLAVAIGLASARDPRTVLEHDRRESHRFAFAVADIVGRTRAVDLHRDVRVALHTIRRRQPRTTADVAVAAVLVDGPRRLAAVVVLTIALLLGVAPFPVPPVWAVAALLVAAASMSVAHSALSGGRIRFGDRTRWSNSALGEVLSPADHDDLAPRRWVGTVGIIVVINLAVALRGMSDRWTHGLPPMDAADRFVTMMAAVVLVVGAVYTLRTVTSPQLPNAHLVSRRLEERTARQSALGGAVCIGVIGLIAGVLPGGVDATDGDPARIEQISDDELEPARLDTPTLSVPAQTGGRSLGG